MGQDFNWQGFRRILAIYIFIRHFIENECAISSEFSYGAEKLTPSAAAFLPNGSCKEILEKFLRNCKEIAKKLRFKSGLGQQTRTYWSQSKTSQQIT